MRVSLGESRPAPGAGEVRAFYNATHARSVLRDSDRFYRWMARRILGLLPPRRPERAAVLDVGCGGGYLLREIGRLGGASPPSLHGLEISEVALREARRQVPGARWVLGQGERLPYPDRSFDAVACLGNLEHFVDPRAGARELARVSRRDGGVCLLLPNSFYSGAIWRAIVSGYGPDHHQILERFATVNEWRDLLEECGLAVEAISAYNRFKWWKRLLPRNLAWHFLYLARPAG